MDSLDKDNSILWTVQHLASKFGASSFKIKDHWEGDTCAIGLADVTENYLVYISTQHLEDYRYYVALENPPNSNDLPYEPAGEFDNIDLNELESLVERHLRIKLDHQ